MSDERHVRVHNIRASVPAGTSHVQKMKKIHVSARSLDRSAHQEAQEVILILAVEQRRYAREGDSRGKQNFLGHQASVPRRLLKG